MGRVGEICRACRWRWRGPTVPEEERVDRGEERSLAGGRVDVDVNQEETLGPIGRSSGTGRSSVYIGGTVERSRLLGTWAKGRFCVAARGCVQEPIQRKRDRV